MDHLLALRMDDIGASSKEFEIYSKKWRGLGNILFLKRLPYFNAWAKYRELEEKDWHAIFHILRKYKAKLTVAVTAAWVHYDGTMTPYPEKFPAAASALKEGIQEGLIELANHGLTHCVLKDFLFRPKWFTSNRKFHREFWEWIDRESHFEHIKTSQEILTSFFQVPVTTLVPPGNVYCKHTLDAAKKFGINLVNCNTTTQKYKNIRIISDENICAFHDKEIVEFGYSWLESTLEKHKEKTFVFVKDIP